MSRFFASLATAWLLILSLVKPTFGHPHMWVDLESRVVLSSGDDGIIIQQVWLFDDFFSTSVIEDASLNPEGKNVGIQEEVDRILVALEPYNYFTTIKFDGKNLSSKLVGDVTWEVIQNRIKMRFALTIDELVGVETRTWSYAIFDPTYYIEMLHADSATVTIESNAAVTCNSWIEQPNPSADAVALSQSTTLDKNADDTVGRFFAETVHVSCG